MAVDIIWMPEARQDLIEIVEYISNDNVDAAIRVYDEMLESVERLHDFPEAGHPLLDYPDHNFRELLLYSYRIIYQFNGSVVEVLAIVHGARLLPEIMKSRRGTS